MGVLFPPYYAVGAGAGTLALVAALVVWRRAAGVARAFTVGALGIMLAANVVAGWVVQPRAAALRPALHGEQVAQEARAEFDRLHRVAVALNAIVLVLGLATVATVAVRTGASLRGAVTASRDPTA
jgi:cytochrome b